MSHIAAGIAEAKALPPQLEPYLDDSFSGMLRQDDGLLVRISDPSADEPHGVSASPPDGGYGTDGTWLLGHG